MRGPVLLSVCFLAVGVGGAVGCQKGDDGAGKPSPVPPMVPSAAPMAPAAAPPVAPPPPAPAAVAAPGAAPGPGGSITGKIVLSSATAKVKPEGTLYLVGRRISDNPNARGTLIAVKKMSAASFPLAFSLTAADMPFQPPPLEGELTLTARIDQDGNPLTYQKGDVFGTIPKVQVGAHDVKLTLDQVQKQDESLGGGGPMMGGGHLPAGHP